MNMSVWGGVPKTISSECHEFQNHDFEKGNQSSYLPFNFKLAFVNSTKNPKHTLDMCPKFVDHTCRHLVVGTRCITQSCKTLNHEQEPNNLGSMG
jgi:hypothetical protein